MKIIFFCEASLEIGTGHVMRCIALASSLKLAGCDIIFATSKTTTTLINKVNNFNIIDPHIFMNNPLETDLR